MQLAWYILLIAIAVNIVSAGFNLLMMRRAVLLVGLLMDICLRAFSLRAFPGGLIKATGLSVTTGKASNDRG